MIYVKSGTPFMSYPNKLRQVFLHNPKTQINKANTIALYVEEKIDDADIEIIEFIWKAAFSTKEQIHRFALANNIEYFDERMKKLFENHLFHKFYLCDDRHPAVKAPADAEMIYCLSEGGKQIIENYCDDFIIWGLNDISMTSNMIAKSLVDTELWLDITYGTNNLEVMEYSKHPIYYLTQKFIISSHYRFKLQDGSYYMLVDIIRSQDEMLKIRPRLRQMHSLLAKQTWRKYYPDTNAVPMLIIVTETDAHAYQIAQEIAQTTDISADNYRLTTSERLRSGINNDDSFLVYNKEEDALFPTSIGLFKN